MTPPEPFLERLANFFFSTQEGLAAVEIMILIAMVYMIFYMRSMAKEIKKNEAEARESRGRIYDFIRDEIGKLREEMNEKFKEVWTAIKDHNETCQLQNQVAERWRGAVDAKLENLEKKMDK